MVVGGTERSNDVLESDAVPDDVLGFNLSITHVFHLKYLLYLYIVYSCTKPQPNLLRNYVLHTQILYG